MRQNEVKTPFLTKTRTPSPSGSSKTSKLIKIKVLIGSEWARTMQNRFKSKFGEFEHTKLIFLAKLEFYLKWSLVPLSVIGMKPSESENENMSNSRNLFCMVAISFFRLRQTIPT